jgi:oligoribonuclease NrnB/cAMP/cGMP phosphodiesterase (DHH superfamily)
LSSLAQIPRPASSFPEASHKEDVTVVSHSKDADGICSAALIHHLTGANVILTDYVEMVETMSKIDPAKEIFVCDLGLNKTTFDGFLQELKRLLNHGQVHYIDHHPIDQEYEQKLKEAGIDLYHSKDESAAVLVYEKFESQLGNDPKMKVLACCGAITDYLDLQPFARKLISSFDRQFLLYEATVLSFSIAMIGRDGPVASLTLKRFVEELGAQGKFPHEIDNASSYAQEFVSNSAKLIEKARRHGKKMKNFAYIKTREASSGNAANFLIGALDVLVGVVFKEDGPDDYEISLRSIQESKHDLGKIVGKISNELEASGGGHVHAAGSRIRKDQFDQFIQMLDHELSNPV